mmetsp:Transcript_105728/g.340886  ORF Transcript_105728/g.340886 Transcript_105728/m.340886 type:complete len:91 (-) Transcript_105728:1075-1347(-)
MPESASATNAERATRQSDQGGWQESQGAHGKKPHERGRPDDETEKPAHQHRGHTYNRCQVEAEKGPSDHSFEKSFLSPRNSSGQPAPRRS